MKGTLHKQFKKSGKKVLILVNGVLLALLAYFAMTTVYSSDDYWYSTFWNEGLKHYLELMEYHYQSFNGRVLVHVLAHIVLHFDSWAYVIMCCGLLVLGAWIVTKASSMETERFQAVLCVLLIGIFCMPLDMFNQGLMWVSASCNYLFPVILACLLAAALERQSRWALPLAFLCGATTEQMGLAASALCAAYTGRALLRRKGVLRCTGCTLLTLMGVLTIFLSPATRLRAGQNVRLDSLEALLEILRMDILLEADLLTGNPAPVLVMLAVLCLGALLLWYRAGLRWPAALAVLGGTALIAGSIGSDLVCLVGYGIGFVALAVLGGVLLVRSSGISGALILTALAAAAVMLPTDTIEPRVMLPVYLLLLLAGCDLLVIQLPDLDRIVIPAVAALTLTLVMMVPAVEGYWYNYQVDKINKEYAQEDMQKSFVRYCIDYDMNFTWSKANFDGYFRSKYAESIGLSETAPIRFFSNHVQMDPVRCGDRELVWLSIQQENGTVLFPLREIVETMGGVLEWYGKRMVVRLNGTEYELWVPEENTVIVSWTDETGAVRELQGERTLSCSVTYCDETVFAQAFGFQISRDENSGYYMIVQ